MSVQLKVTDKNGREVLSNVIILQREAILREQHRC